MGSAVKNLYEAKTQLSKLVDRASKGEEFILAKDGVPLARLGPLAHQDRRKPGGWEGKVWIADDFNGPMPDEEMALWEGEGPVSPPLKRKRKRKK